jgi:hypothetical protein
LAGLDGSVEAYDQSGQVIGYFLSSEEYKKLIYAWAKAEFEKSDLEDPIDDDDESGSMTTAEVLAYLEKLGQSQTGAA